MNLIAQSPAKLEVRKTMIFFSCVPKKNGAVGKVPIYLSIFELSILLKYKSLSVCFLSVRGVHFDTQKSRDYIDCSTGRSFYSDQSSGK